MNTAYFENYSKVTKEKAIERQICRQAANFYQQKLFSNDGSHALHYQLEHRLMQTPLTICKHYCMTQCKKRMMYSFIVYQK